MDTRARWLTILIVVLLLAAGVPAGWSAAQEGERNEPFGGTGPTTNYGDSRIENAEFSAAFTPLIQTGNTGDILYTDSPSAPGTACGTYADAFPPIMEIAVWMPIVYPSGNFAQNVAAGFQYWQVLPNSDIELVGLTELAFGVASPTLPVDFDIHTLVNVPVGPTFLTIVDVFWFDAFGEVDGHFAYLVDFYDTLVNDGGGWQSLGVADACYSLFDPVAAISPERGTVNASVGYAIAFYPIDVPVTVRWDSMTLGSTRTDFFGSSAGTLRVPAAPMGNHTVSFLAGEWQAATTFTVVPRIKIIPGEASRGDTVDVSLRGYKARETVRIRWERDGSWVELARVTTSGTGSANVDVVVPDWAPVGQNSVRGDSTNSSGGRAQTNAFSVDDVPLPEPGTLLLGSIRGTVNSRVTATVGNFPPNETVTVTFRGFYEATASAMTDATGAATMSFKVPASPKGFHGVEATGGNVEATATYEIVPRIKLTPGQAARGDPVGVSLRGYGAREIVRIRWQLDGSFEQLTTVTTSGSGSANLDITVPLAAPDGSASVRGDGPIGRAQTNAFVVSGGPFEPAAVEESSPTPTATPEAAETASPTTEPTATVEPTLEPTATPTEVPPVEPTATTEAPTDPPAEASPSPETTGETT
ncbi:MAG: hypothetical protein ACRDJW_05370 [Thermomicrobiales bacterium]